MCPQAASGCSVPMYNALELKSRRFRQHIAFYRNPRKGTHGGRQRGHPEASSRMRQLIPPIPRKPFRRLVSSKRSSRPRRREVVRRAEAIGEADPLIAAHPLTLGLTLVTNNERQARSLKQIECTDRRQLQMIVRPGRT